MTPKHAVRTWSLHNVYFNKTVIMIYINF